MSLAESEELAEILNGYDSELKLQELKSWKTRFKRERVDQSAVANFLHEFRNAAVSANTHISLAALQCLYHILKRLNYQPESLVPKNLHASLAKLLTSKIDEKDSRADHALHALLELYSFAPDAVENELVENGFNSKNPKARLSSLLWLQKVHASNDGFSFKAYTPILCQLLEDPNEQVRDLAHSVVKDFFINASDGAKLDLNIKLKAAGVRQSITNSVLEQIGFRNSAATKDTSSARRDRIDRSNLENSYSKRVASTDSLHSTESTVQTYNSAFLNGLPKNNLEKVEPLFVNNGRELESMFASMQSSFAGREDEQNWTNREKNITCIRRILRGDAATSSLRPHLISLLQDSTDGILKSLLSLRTTLSMNASNLIREMALLSVEVFSGTLDQYLECLIRIVGSTKKIAVQAAHLTVCTIIDQAQFNHKLLNIFSSVSAEKSPQLRQFCQNWLVVVIEAHTERLILRDRSALETIERLISKGLSDQNPLVRANAKQAFSVFFTKFPERADIFQKSLDFSVRKQIEKMGLLSPKSKLARPTNKKIPFGTRSLQRKMSDTSESNPNEGNILSEKGENVQSNRLGFSSSAVKRSLRLPQRQQVELVKGDSFQKPLRVFSESTSDEKRAGQSRSLSANSKRSVSAAMSHISQRLSLIEQLTHEDQAVRKRGIESLLQALNDYKESGSFPTSIASIVEKDSFKRLLLNLLNDPEPKISNSLLQPRLMDVYATLGLKDDILPILLDFSEVSSEKEPEIDLQKNASECIDELKDVLHSTTGFQKLFEILMNISSLSAGQKKGTGNILYTSARRQRITNGALCIMSDILTNRTVRNQFEISSNQCREWITGLMPLLFRININSVSFTILVDVLAQLLKTDVQIYEDYEKQWADDNREPIRYLQEHLVKVARRADSALSGSVYEEASEEPLREITLPIDSNDIEAKNKEESQKQQNDLLVRNEILDGNNIRTAEDGSLEKKPLRMKISDNKLSDRNLPESMRPSPGRKGLETKLSSPERKMSHIKPATPERKLPESRLATPKSFRSPTHKAHFKSPHHVTSEGKFESHLPSPSQRLGFKPSGGSPTRETHQIHGTSSVNCVRTEQNLPGEIYPSIDGRRSHMHEDRRAFVSPSANGDLCQEEDIKSDSDVGGSDNYSSFDEENLTMIPVTFMRNKLAVQMPTPDGDMQPLAQRKIGIMPQRPVPKVPSPKHVPPHFLEDSMAKLSVDERPTIEEDRFEMSASAKISSGRGPSSVNHENSIAEALQDTADNTSRIVSGQTDVDSFPITNGVDTRSRSSLKLDSGLKLTNVRPTTVDNLNAPYEYSHSTKLTPLRSSPALISTFSMAGARAEATGIASLATAPTAPTAVVTAPATTATVSRRSSSSAVAALPAVDVINIDLSPKYYRNRYSCETPSRGSDSGGSRMITDDESQISELRSSFKSDDFEDVRQLMDARNLSIFLNSSPQTRTVRKRTSLPQLRRSRTASSHADGQTHVVRETPGSSHEIPLSTSEQRKIIDVVLSLADMYTLSDNDETLISALNVLKFLLERRSEEVWVLRHRMFSMIMSLRCKLHISHQFGILERLSELLLACSEPEEAVATTVEYLKGFYSDKAWAQPDVQLEIRGNMNGIAEALNLASKQILLLECVQVEQFVAVLGKIVSRTLDSLVAEIRRFTVQVCVSMMRVLGDCDRVCDAITDLKPFKRDLIMYYFVQQD